VKDMEADRAAQQLAHLSDPTKRRRP